MCDAERDDGVTRDGSDVPGVTSRFVDDGLSVEENVVSIRLEGYDRHVIVERDSYLLTSKSYIM